MTDAEPMDEWGMGIALAGLRRALYRFQEFHEDAVPDQTGAAVSTVEFVNWACALDERLRGADGGYEGRRDLDPDGQVIPALRFVRDRHMHQVVSSAAVQFTLGWSSQSESPTLIGAAFTWRSIADIPEPTGDRTHRPWYVASRAAYVDRLQGEPVEDSLIMAVRFLLVEVERHFPGVGSAY